jgi:hypothetical protein
MHDYRNRAAPDQTAVTDEGEPRGLEVALQFPLVEALYGRRARRFSLGAEIPDGPLAFASRHKPVPLSDLEQMLVLTAAGGNTGWHYLITRHARYAPHLSNYSVLCRRRRAHLPLGRRLPHQRVVLHQRRWRLRLRHP